MYYNRICVENLTAYATLTLTVVRKSSCTFVSLPSLVFLHYPPTKILTVNALQFSQCEFIYIFTCGGKKGKTDVYHAYSTANGILYYSKIFDIIAVVIPVFAHMYLCAWYDDQHEISFYLFIPTIMTWFLLTHVRNKYRIMPKNIDSYLII